MQLRKEEDNLPRLLHPREPMRTDVSAEGCRNNSGSSKRPKEKKIYTIKRADVWERSANVATF